MKIRNSLKSAKTRDKNCVVVRRRGRLYVLNQEEPPAQGPPGLRFRLWLLARLSGASAFPYPSRRRWTRRRGACRRLPPRRRRPRGGLPRRRTAASTPPWISPSPTKPHVAHLPGDLPARARRILQGEHAAVGAAVRILPVHLVVALADLGRRGSGPWPVSVPAEARNGQRQRAAPGRRMGGAVFLAAVRRRARRVAAARRRGNHRALTVPPGAPALACGGAAAHLLARWRRASRWAAAPPRLPEPEERRT